MLTSERETLEERKSKSLASSLESEKAKYSSSVHIRGALSRTSRSTIAAPLALVFHFSAACNYADDIPCLRFAGDGGWSFVREEALAKLCSLPVCLFSHPFVSERGSQ